MTRLTATPSAAKPKPAPEMPAPEPSVPEPPGKPALVVPTLRRRLKIATVPSLRFGAVCVAVLLLTVGYGLHAKGFAPFPRTAIALSVLALPPALAAMLAAWLIDVLLPVAGRVWRGILMAFALVAIGPGASAAFFNLAYRMSYPSELAPVWTKAGLYEAIWTGISTTYLYLIAAPALYWPWTAAAVLALAAAFAARRPAFSLPGPSH